MSTKMKKRNEDALQMMRRRYGRLTVGRLLHAWRLCDEMSQVEFAKKLKISVQSLCDLEKGRRIPSPERAAKIAKAIGYPEIVLVKIALEDSLEASGFKFRVTLESA